MLSDETDEDFDEEDVEEEIKPFRGPNLIKSIGVFFAIAALIFLIILLLMCVRACAATNYSCFKCYMVIKTKVFYNLFIRFAL